MAEKWSCWNDEFSPSKFVKCWNHSHETDPSFWNIPLFTANRVSLLWKNSHFAKKKFQSNALFYITCHDSVNFCLHFKILVRFLEWKIKILRFSNSHTWNSTILLNLTNYFHLSSHVSSLFTYFNDCFTLEACFLQVSTGFIPKFEFLTVLKPPKCIKCLKSFDKSLIQKGLLWLDQLQWS